MHYSNYKTLALTTDLTSLPLDMLKEILSHADSQSLLAARLMNTELCNLFGRDDVWRFILSREFPSNTQCVSPYPVSWYFLEFIRLKIKEETERAEAEAKESELVRMRKDQDAAFDRYCSEGLGF